MSLETFAATRPGQQYAPSGRIGAMFLPLAAVAVAVALVMAWVLYLAEAHGLYYYVLAPLVVGAPVIGALFLLLHVGQCRNPAAGLLTSLAIVLVYYVGYWQISYYQTVVTRGPVAVFIVRNASGLPGVFGYFVLRCRTSVVKREHDRNSDREPTRFDEVFNYFFHGWELLFLGFFAAVGGRNLPRRVFYEQPARWGKRFDLAIPRKDETALLAALESEDWPALAHLPRLASDMGSSREVLNALSVRFEFLPGGADQPVYLTVHTKARSRLAGPLLALLSGFGSGQIRQRELSPESAARLAESFPDKITIATSSAPAKSIASSATPTTSPAPAPTDDHAARDLAIAQSQPFAADPFSESGTLIFPADIDRLKHVQRYAWGYVISMFACLGVAMGSALVMINLLDEDQQAPMTPLQILFTVLFVAGMFAGLLSIFFYYPLAAALRRRRLARRPGSFLPAMASLKRREFRLSFARQFDLKEKGVDDIVSCAADATHQRLYIEGIRYRYIIPAAAIQQFAPLQSGQTTALQLDFEAAGHTLQVVLARDNIKAHLKTHFWWLPIAGDAERLCRNIRRELGLPPLPA